MNRTRKQNTQNCRTWRQSNRAAYNAYMRAYRARKRKEKK